MSVHDDEVTGRAYDHRLMRRLLAYLRPYRGEVAWRVIVSIADAVVQLAGPLLTMEAIDNGIRHRDPPHLERVATLYVTVLVIGFGLGYLQTQIMQRVRPDAGRRTCAWVCSPTSSGCRSPTSTAARWAG